MADLEDVFEAAFEIEDIAEEIFEPGDLLEDLAENALAVGVALLAVLVALVTLLLLVLSAVALLVAPDLFLFVAVFAVGGCSQSSISSARFSTCARTFRAISGRNSTGPKSRRRRRPTTAR